MTRMKKQKIAIVMSGGGMQCVYGAGVLVALAEEYGLREPDILIAPSGSAGSASYYLAGQYEKIALMWLSLSTDPRFISIFKAPIVDIDYLVKEVFMKKIPLNLSALKKRKTKLFFPVLRARDTALTYLRVHATPKIYAGIRATLAAPFIFGKRVKVRGRYYVDGAFGPTVHEYMQKAVAEGATTIIVIVNGKHEYSPLAKVALAAVAKHGTVLGQKRYVINATKKVVGQHVPYVPPPEVTVVPIVPTRALSIGVLGGSKINYRVAFNMGYEDAVQNEALKHVLRPAV